MPRRIGGDGGYPEMPKHRAKGPSRELVYLSESTNTAATNMFATQNRRSTRAGSLRKHASRKAPGEAKKVSKLSIAIIKRLNRA